MRITYSEDLGADSCLSYLIRMFDCSWIMSCLLRLLLSSLRGTNRMIFRRSGLINGSIERISP
jgi:hypothetical protein